MIRRYSIHGVAATILEIQKLGWFLQRSVKELGLRNPLGYQFEPNRYGPYADEIRHQLNDLDGSYLHAERRISDSNPFEPLYFDDSKASIVREFFAEDEAMPYEQVLEHASQIIDGFESPLGMELLSTVDWLLQHGCEPTVESLTDGLQNWPVDRSAVERKLRILDRRLLEIALERLTSVSK